MKGAIIFISIFVWGNLVGKKQYVFVVECIMATIELMLYKKIKNFTRTLYLVLIPDLENQVLVLNIEFLIWICIC